MLKLNPRGMLKVAILAGFYSLVTACTPADAPAEKIPTTTEQTATHQAAVALPDSFSADAARAILEKGGNAVDAAITAQFVLAVTLPEAGNIGGGGFMLIHKDGKNDFIDYREKAPLNAHRDMYLDEKGDVIPNQSLIGALASGVPGTVAGMWLAHQKYGSLPWQDLLQPAVDLAEQGFIVPAKLGGYIERHIDRLASRGFAVNFKDYFAAAKTDELFKQTELAATLKRIRDQGRDGFYLGETAKLVADFMRKQNGLITEEDMAGYQAAARKPIMANWRGYQLVTSPPPSSGGVAIVQWLKMYDFLTQEQPTQQEPTQEQPTQQQASAKQPTLEHNSAEYIHLLAEIGKRVFADRAEYLGDPDFVNVPVAKLIADSYIAERSQGIAPDKISETESIKPGLKESEETTHFSIMDKWGNGVSNTTTINLGFGSSVVVEGAGFLLNDEMDDFSAKPGVANVFGAVGGTANEIQPQKRMLSSMTPSMVLKDGKITMITGSPGGTTIISSVYESILNALVYNMDAQATVDSPRFHHQLLPKDQIRVHPGFAPEVLKQLEELGYNINNSRFGDMHVILNKDGKVEAGSEASGRGKAMVF